MSAEASAKAGAGLDLALTRNLTLGISCVGQLGNNVHDHGAKGKFIRRF